MLFSNWLSKERRYKRMLTLPMLLLVSASLHADVLEAATPMQPPQVQEQLSESVNFYSREVERQLVEGDAYAPQLAESLLGLGRVYRKQQDYQQALTTLTQALHIEKVSNGLSSISQEPLLRELVMTHLTLGDWEGAVNDMSALDRVYLHEYGADDPARIPLMMELSHWHLQAFVMRGKRVSDHLVAANGYAEEGIRLVKKNYGEHDLQLVEHIRNSALSNYYMAIFLDDAEQFANNRGFYFGAQQLEPSDNNAHKLFAHVYRNGRNDYREMVSLLYSSDQATALQRAAAHAELGDWFLLFDNKQAALAAYRDLLAQIDNVEQREEIRKAVFGQLRSLPVSSVSDPTVNEASLRVVDVEMALGEYGKVDQVKVLGIQGEESIDDQEAKRAVRLLRTQRFRPLLENDQLIPRQGLRRKFRVEL